MKWLDIIPVWQSPMMSKESTHCEWVNNMIILNKTIIIIILFLFNTILSIIIVAIITSMTIINHHYIYNCKQSNFFFFSLFKTNLLSPRDIWKPNDSHFSNMWMIQEVLLHIKGWDLKTPTLDDVNTCPPQDLVSSIYVLCSIPWSMKVGK